jgi:Zn-dependent protease with chaperone function
MTSLSGSAFLQALGWAIAGSLWQMALLWTIYQLCFGVWRNIRASVKTAAATVLQMAGFGWFVCSLVGHYWKLKMAAPASAAYFSVAPEPSGHDLLFYVNRGLAWSEHYLPYLSGAYLLVLAFLLARVFKAYRHVQAVRTEGLSKIDAEWRVYVRDLAQRIGIRRDIRVWLSEKIDIPATIGYMKPLILLPIATFNHLSPEQVEAILLHELAHIKRHDYLLNLILTVMDTVLFFNPFAQLIARHIRTERENSCDDFVLQFRYNPHVYASALLSLEQQRLSPELAMAAAGKTDLLDRIKRIMNVPSRPMNYGQKLMALLITAGILASLAWLTPDNIEHKPILKTMAVFLPTPPAAPTEPVIEAPAPAPAPMATKAHKPCPAPKAAVVTDNDAQDLVLDESQPTGDVVWTPQSDASLAEKTLNVPLQSKLKVAFNTIAFNTKSFFKPDTRRTLKIQIDSAVSLWRKNYQDDQDAYARAAEQQKLEFVRVYEGQGQTRVAFEKAAVAQRRNEDAARLALEKTRLAQRIAQVQTEEALHLAEERTAEAQRLATLRDQQVNRQVQVIQFQERKLRDSHLTREQARHIEDQIDQEKKKTLQVIQDLDKKLLNLNRNLISFAPRMKVKAKVLDQASDDDDNGISADQPGFQAPAAAYDQATSRLKIIPVLYTSTYLPAKHKTATMAYRERYTIYPASRGVQESRGLESDFGAGGSVGANGPGEDEDQSGARVSRSTSVDLVHKLETDGFLAGSCNVRIILENNSLIINGEHQSDAVYARYKDCLDGRAIVVLSTGKVIQVTVR